MENTRHVTTTQTKQRTNNKKAEKHKPTTKNQSTHNKCQRIQRIYRKTQNNSINTIYTRTY